MTDMCEMMKIFIRHLTEDRKRQREESLCDVQFVLKDDEGKDRQVLAHKLLLSSHSRIFRQQFEACTLKDDSDCQDFLMVTDDDFSTLVDARDEDKISVLHIVDSTYAAFKFFIDIIYGDAKIDLCPNRKILEECVKLARKYQIKKLYDKSIGVLSKLYESCDNCCEMAERCQHRRRVHLHQLRPGQNLLSYDLERCVVKQSSATLSYLSQLGYRHGDLTVIYCDLDITKFCPAPPFYYRCK